jgi:hypothetical protein
MAQVAGGCWGFECICCPYTTSNMCSQRHWGFAAVEHWPCCECACCPSITSSAPARRVPRGILSLAVCCDMHTMHAMYHPPADPDTAVHQEGCVTWAIAQNDTCQTGSLLPHLERYHQAGCRVYINQQYNPAPQHSSAALRSTVLIGPATAQAGHLKAGFTIVSQWKELLGPTAHAP